MSRSRHSFNRQPDTHYGSPVTQGQALFKKANEAYRSGNHAAALVLYRQCAVLQPDRAIVFFNLGCCLQAQDDHRGAADAYRHSLTLKPNADTHANLAETLRQLGQLGDALHHCNAAIAADPRLVEAYVVRSAIHWTEGRQDDAIADLNNAIHWRPQHADAHFRLGAHLSSLGRDREAIVHYEKACALRPSHAPSHLALGDRYKAVGRTWEAFESLRAASQLEPENAKIYSDLAALLCHTPMLDMAISTARLARQIAPNLASAAFNLGTALTLKGNHDEAVEAYGKALELDPNDGEALFQLCKLHESACDWDGLDTAQALARTMTYKSGRRAAPFSVLSMTPSPAEHLLSARNYAAKCVKQVGPAMTAYLPRPAEARAARLKIGYLSSDFHTHATADLIAEVFELHDRAKFEVFGYSLGVNDDSPMRKRLIAAFDQFHDIRGVELTDAAKLIANHGIDILVDLKGYTQGCRPEIMALRPAPVQVNYLGYPSTMGAAFIDYIVGDPHVTPFDHAPYYDEKIVQLPNSYQPNDRKRPVAADRPSRAEHGLPETGFVFCCFNNTYKISKDIFTVWMGLLASVDGSVLWLLQNDENVVRNLRREAERAGIAPERLVFARRIPSAGHLARVPLADLFLDTLLYNAHTTASEALWVGVPVVTCVGQAFPARVGSSLLHSAGLSDLVTHNLDDYAAKALRLAQDAEALRAVRERLAKGRATAPLFDMPLFTRHLEQAYEKMTALRDAGEPPAAFAIV